PGELKRINEKWFGSSINRYGRYLPYAGYAAAAALLLIAGLAAWNRTLRKGILQRTAALAESEQRFRRIARRLLEVQETERRHIARELHDEIGQGLTAIKLSLERGAREPPDRVQGSVGQALGLATELVGRVRDLSLELRPAVLDDLGLLPALTWQFGRYTGQFKIRVNFTHGGLDQRRFRPDIETAAYRIVQEALTNVARHAGVGAVDVGIQADESSVRIRIRDEGAGFDVRSRSAGGTGGLSGMRERAVMSGGRLDVESAPGAGTLLTAELPLGTGRENRDSAAGDK
ncbi:MAG TPA: sensor histidine kinase, partial [Candidatus Binatia bacterium]